MNHRILYVIEKKPKIYYKDNIKKYIYYVNFVVTELTSGKTRTLLCLLMNMWYPIGYILLSIIAYYVRPWRILLLVLSLPILGLLIQCW